MVGPNTQYRIRYRIRTRAQLYWLERSPSQAGTVWYRIRTLYSYSVFCIGVDSTLSQSRFGAASVFCIRIPFLYWVTLPVLARVPYSVFVFCIRILYHETGGFCIGTVTGPLISRSWARQARVKATLLGSVGVVIVS